MQVESVNTHSFDFIVGINARQVATFDKLGTYMTATGVAIAYIQSCGETRKKLGMDRGGKPEERRRGGELVTTRIKLGGTRPGEMGGGGRGSASNGYDSVAA